MVILTLKNERNFRYHIEILLFSSFDGGYLLCGRTKPSEHVMVKWGEITLFCLQESEPVEMTQSIYIMQPL